MPNRIRHRGSAGSRWRLTLPVLMALDGFAGYGSEDDVFASEAEAHEAYAALRDQLFARVGPTPSFWAWEPGIPDDLRPEVGASPLRTDPRYLADPAIAPSPAQLAEWRARDLAHDAHELRRASWLRASGYVADDGDVIHADRRPMTRDGDLRPGPARRFADDRRRPARGPAHGQDDEQEDDGE